MSTAKPSPGVKKEPPKPSEGTGWSVVSYLVGGMLLYGGLGWLIGRWTHIEALTGVGLVVGIGLSLALIIYRFTRPSD
jgi:ATP synthase protein I